MLTVSLSAYQSWQRCEQRYFYSYVRRLRQKVMDLAPERGVLLHEYLAGYYRMLQAGASAEDSHTESLATLSEEQRPKLSASANISFFAGDEELAAQYMELMDVVERIAERYYIARGRGDAERYDVLLVEERIRIELLTEVFSVSVIDLVLRDRDYGMNWLVEHKSTGNVPNSDVRMRDLQTMLYAAVLAHEREMPIYATLWNYLRTKEPRVPTPLKAKGREGELSRAEIDSDWTTYKGALLNAGLNPDLYTDMEMKLEGKEHSVFFPRFEQVIVADPEVLLGDYVTTASRIRMSTMQWTSGIGRPIRTLSRDCSFCPFNKICEAALTGGDAEDVIQRNFTEGHSS